MPSFVNDLNQKVATTKLTEIRKDLFHFSAKDPLGPFLKTESNLALLDESVRSSRDIALSASLLE